MFFPRLLQVRTFVMLVTALVLTVVSYGFAASNTVPATNAGDGTNSVYGNTVSAVSYTLNASKNVTAVSFTLAADGSTTPTNVDVTFDGTTWYDCTLSSGTYSCSIGTPVSLTSINNLRVVANQ